MREMYLLLFVLLFQLAFEQVRANDPNQSRNMISGYESIKQAEASSLMLHTIPQGNKVNAFIFNQTAGANISTAAISTIPGAVMKGIKTTSRIIDALNSEANKVDVFTELNMGKRHNSRANNVPEIVDFLNSLARLAARYNFKGKCCLFGKFKISSQFVNVGLSF